MIRPKRNANHQGDPAESDRLIVPFLGWTGRRTNRECFMELGIDPKAGAEWLARRRVLADPYQRIVRQTLADAGVLPSPCG